MSTIAVKQVKLGNDIDPSNNFVISVPAVADGTVKLARGDAGATTQDILTVDASGNVNATVGIEKAGSALQALSDFTGTNASLAASGYQKLPGGLIIQWGTVTGITTSDVVITFPIAFPTNTVHVGIQARGDSNGPVSSKEVGAPPKTITTTSFTLKAGPDSGYYGGVFLWFAIGY